MSSEYSNQLSYAPWVERPEFYASSDAQARITWALLAALGAGAPRLQPPPPADADPLRPSRCSRRGRRRRPPTPAPGHPGTPRAAGHAPATADPHARVVRHARRRDRAAAGFLLDDRLFSPIIGESFTYRVYLPPDYQRAPTRRYPVLYMLHGNGGNYTEWSDSFLPEQADRMIVAGEIPPLIIVMPDDGEATYWANWSEAVRAGPTTSPTTSWRHRPALSHAAQSAQPRRRRHVDGRPGRAQPGLSAPDVFGVVGGHSPSVRLKPDPALWFLVGDNFWEHNPVWLAQNRDGHRSRPIWLDAGTDDVWLPNIKAVRDALIDRGIEPTWNNFPGPHEAEYWIEHMPDYLRFYSERSDARLTALQPFDAKFVGNPRPLGIVRPLRCPRTCALDARASFRRLSGVAYRLASSREPDDSASWPARRSSRSTCAAPNGISGRSTAGAGRAARHGRQRQNFGQSWSIRPIGTAGCSWRPRSSSAIGAIPSGRRRGPDHYSHPRELPRPAAPDHRPAHHPAGAVPRPLARRAARASLRRVQA